MIARPQPASVDRPDHYANMIDIITNDDLLRRMNNTIVALGGDPGDDVDDTGDLLASEGLDLDE